MEKSKTTYEILNFQDLFDKTETKGLHFAKITGLSITLVYRLINGRSEKLSQKNFDKLFKYYGNDLKYKAYTKHFKTCNAPQGVTKNELYDKLAKMRAKQGRNPDGSLFGTKSNRMQEIEEEVKYENEKTERIKLLYKKQGVDLKVTNKLAKDINVTCNLGKTY